MSENADPVVEKMTDSENPVEGAIAGLKEKFPDLVDDLRDGYSGLMVAPNQLLGCSKSIARRVGV